MKSLLALFTAGFILLTAGLARAVPQGGSFESLDRQARSGARLNIVFFGGPFTKGVGLEDDKDSWRARFQQFLVERHPGAEFHFDVVSMGDAGSKRAMFQTLKLLTEKKPDLVFLDFLIDDGIQGQNRDTLAAYECILNDLARAGVPIMQVFPGVRAVQGSFWKPVMPQRLRDYIEFVKLYRTGVGESYQSLHQLLVSKQYTMDDIWPDNANYPTVIGHELIFTSLRQGYLEAVEQKRHGMFPFEPVFARLYQSRQEITLADLPLAEGWTKGPASLPLAAISGKPVDKVAVWDSGADNSAHPLRLDFRGTLVAISGEADADSLGFKVMIDGRPVMQPESKDTTSSVLWTIPTDGSGSEKTGFWLELTSRLASGSHSLELIPVAADSGRTGQLRLGSIFIAGE